MGVSINPKIPYQKITEGFVCQGGGGGGLGQSNNLRKKLGPLNLLFGTGDLSLLDVLIYIFKITIMPLLTKVKGS